MAFQPQSPMPLGHRSPQPAGTAASIAIIAAIVGWVVLFNARPGWSFVLQIIAVIAGILGLLMAASPRVGGGVASIIGMVLGAVGLVFAILGMVGSVFV